MHFKRSEHKVFVVCVHIVNFSAFKFPRTILFPCIVRCSLQTTQCWRRSFDELLGIYGVIKSYEMEFVIQDRLRSKVF